MIDADEGACRLLRANADEEIEERDRMGYLTKREFLKCSTVGVAATTLGSALLAVETDAQERPSSKQTSTDGESAQYLFVQTSHSITSSGDRLTLHGVSPTTLFFSDRPQRITGHGATEEWVKTWSEGDDSFASNPPNATLSVLGGQEEVEDVVLVLRDPQLKGSRLTYTVSVLDGELPASGGAASLFIDIIGRPLTPVSVAGEARRTRRVVRRSALY